MVRRQKKRSAEEEGRENGVTRTVVIPSARLGFRKFLALAEVEREYRQMVVEFVKFAHENSISSFTKLKAVKYRDMRHKYPDLPSHYVYTACQDASARVKSFLAKKGRGRACTERPEVRRVSIWLDDHLWKREGYTAVRVATKRGWVAIGLRPHKQFWRYANGGWRLRSEARLKLDHKNRIAYVYFTFEKAVKPYEPRGFLPVDVNENNVTVLVDDNAYLLETDVKRITLGYYYRRKRIQERNDGHAGDLRKKSRALRRLGEGDKKRDVRWKIANIVVQAAYARHYAIVLEKLGENPGRDMIKGIKDDQLRHRIYQAAFKGVQKAIEEKAREWGVPMIYVDPRNTSRLCPIHKSPIEYDGRTRLGKCTAGGEVWHRDVAAVWNLLLRAQGNGSTALSPRAQELSVNGSPVPLGSTAAHEPIRISRSVWARWKSLPQTVNQSKAVGTNGSGQKMSTSL